MKKLSKKLSVMVITLLLIGLLVSPSFSAIKFGVKGGLSLANLSFEPGIPEVDFKSKAGFVGGVSMNIGLSRMFSLQPEVLYVQKGSKFSEGINGDSYEVKINFDYLEIPLLLNLSFQKEGSSFAPSIFAGPYIGLNTSAKAKATYGGETYTEDLKDYIKDTDFGLTFGIGLGKQLGAGKLLLDVRYDLGLTNIVEDAAEGESAKTRTWLFMIGYSF
ncbi:MAG: porin family protein [Acidobacteriota bacterium]|nr:porin family protein [Acidobacteriota bacterium]MDW3229400.1 porin family protein [Acidobacteriota bacterium]MDY0232326.1 porin family protein [Candidatus Saccharicenans sp.]